MVFSLSNTVDIVANTLSVIDENKVIDVRELFLSKLDAIDNIVGLPPDTLNTLQKLGEAINNDSNFYESLIQDLSFKANAKDTYRKTETYTEEEVNQLFTDTSANLTKALALKANEADRILIYAYPLQKRIVDNPFNASGTINELGLNSTFEVLVNSKEPAFTAVAPILKTTNSVTGNIELKISTALTDQVDLKLDRNQVQTMLDAYEPYTSESPIDIFTVRATGARILKMDSTYSQNLLAKASVASVTALGTAVFDEINERLAGYLTPGKIEITSNNWSQIQINNTSDTTDPSEIGFSRANKSQFLKSAMGVSGDLTRGAFWWVGGEDRLNIDCETGVVTLKNGLFVTSIKTDIIQSLTTGGNLRIDNSLVVAGSVSLESYLAVSGAFTAFGDSAFNRNVSITGNLTPTNIIWASGTNGPPALTTRSGGTRIVMYPSVGAASVDYAIGLESTAMWYSVATASNWHRWYNNTNLTMSLTSTGLIVAGQIYQSQGSHTALATTSTLTIAQLLTGIIAGGPTAAITLTLPTGANTHTGLTGGNSVTVLINQGFEWSYINTGTAGATIAASATGHAILMASAVVAPGISARFLTRITAKDTAVTYRIS
jgi:hypothetical protein